MEQLRQLRILNAVAALRHYRGAISTAVHWKDMKHLPKKKRDRYQCCSTRVRDSDSDLSPSRELNLETRDLTWTRALNGSNLTRKNK